MEPWARGLQAGVDEVGIGPLAGPVYAAAVILNPTRSIEGLNDSKVLSKKRRESLCKEIKNASLAWCVGRASVGEVDQLNVLRASHLAMQRAVNGLTHTPDMVLVDGNKKPPLAYPVMTIVRGDGRVPQISAASIIAKVARDAEMVDLDEQFPGYGFAQHKGYPTKKHFSALQNLGACDVHRQSFAPVRAVNDAAQPDLLPT
ncbi:MAG: ribonuclease HII [Pseudomonadales bacterium]|nr:ribonuclease HII [Pseudomonadales bacterium]